MAQKELKQVMVLELVQLPEELALVLMMAAPVQQLLVGLARYAPEQGSHRH